MKKLKRDRPTIGVLAGWHVYPGFIDSFLDHVFHGILSAAQDQECNLLLGCGIGVNFPVSQQRPAWPELLPNFEFIPVGPWNCDGLIVATPIEQAGGMDYLKKLSASGFPLVFAGEREAGRAVVVDNECGIQQAMQHLAGHGHRRVVFISGPLNSRFSDVQHRREAYLSNVKQLGLDPDPALIIYGEHSEEGSRRAMEQILKEGIPFSAVMASNDESAIGAMNALHAAGKLIPEDVAMIGFDDRFEAKAQVPLLTTVHHPMFELGYSSVELLLKTIFSSPVDEEVIRVRPQLIIRESCGCLPGTFDELSSDLQSLEAQITRQSIIDPALAAFPKTSQTQPVFQEIISAINQTISNEMQRLRAAEVSYLSWRLIDSFEKSLAGGEGSNFRQTIQQIIEYVASRGDDVYAWQKAVTIMRDHLPDLLENPLVVISRSQIDDMLHLARVVISEISRGQFSRLMANQSRNASQVGQMTSLFFSAQNENEIFEITSQVLPSIGIPRAVIAYFESDEDDPVAWSQLKYPPANDPANNRFPTREFPPEGLCPADRPFRLALLPLSTPNERLGFIAFEAGNIEYCGFIVRQMMASIKSVRLHREAIEARQVAEEQRKIAEEANRLKSRFLSMISHELRTPLNLISGLSDMLLNEGKNTGTDTQEVHREDLERLYVSAHHLDGLIRDVLDLARIDVGQLRLTREPLSLGDVLKAVSLIGEQFARDKELAWVMEIPDNLPKVWGDRTRLRQVVLNLVTNAAKFTSHGQIVLTASVEERQVIISVEDTGLGIPVDEQEVIFDEFRQSERTTARGYGGLGLGLAICKRLIELHGGTIGVYSSGEEGSGSRFYFSLPVLENQEDLAINNSSLAQAQQVVLLASDPAGIISLKELLIRHGIKTGFLKVGENDEDWTTRLMSASPDIVVVDQGLASTQGWEILKVMNENPDMQKTSVLFYKQPDEKGQGSLFELSYLTKPVREIELAETLISQGLITPEINDAPGKKILIVDDEPGIVELHARIIKSQIPECTIIKAYNGRSALESIHRQHPDLVLLDLMMPEINGFQVLKTMRDEELSRNIPVVVLTSQSLTQEDMERLNAGVVSVLGKSMFNSEEIVSHLKEIMGRRHKPASDSQKSVLKAMAYIHTNYSEAISRHDVAAYVGLSERHLTRCFRQEIGITPITYLNRFRVRQAKGLLEAGKKSITEVALDVGFSTGAYFARVFQEEVGKSPRDFLKEP